MDRLRHPRILAALRLLFWSALLFAVVMAVLPKPPHLPTDRFGDKFQHMLAFATLSFLGSLAFPAFSRWRLVERLCFLGAAIEVVQTIPALGRDAQFTDWLADCAVTALVVGAMALVLRRRD